jgi:hypothetical protein
MFAPFARVAPLDDVDRDCGHKSEGRLVLAVALLDDSGR